MEIHFKKVLEQEVLVSHLMLVLMRVAWPRFILTLLKISTGFTKLRISGEGIEPLQLTIKTENNLQLELTH